MLHSVVPAVTRVGHFSFRALPSLFGAGSVLSDGAEWRRPPERGQGLAWSTVPSVGVCVDRTGKCARGLWARTAPAFLRGATGSRGEKPHLPPTPGWGRCPLNSPRCLFGSWGSQRSGQVCERGNLSQASPRWPTGFLVGSRGCVGNGGVSFCRWKGGFRRGWAGKGNTGPVSGES